MNDAVSASIREHMAKLPKANQQAINAFDWERKCHEVADGYNLTDEEITGLQAEVALVLMGLSDLTTLHRYIDDEIGGTGWEDLETSVIDGVIVPIAQIIEIIDEHQAHFA